MPFPGRKTLITTGSSFGEQVNPNSAIVKQAQANVLTWNNAGAQLPHASEVAFFRDHIDVTGPILQATLQDPSASIRFRAAYVIGSAGAGASKFADGLAVRIEVEPDRLVRIYLYETAGKIANRHQTTLTALRHRWNSLDRTAINPPNSSYYSEAAEAIYVAASLCSLDPDSSARDEYVAYVLQWLKPMPTDTPTATADAWWEMRWSSMIALRSMAPVDGSMPLLEAVKCEPGAKSWVASQVSNTIAVQRR